MTGEWDPLAEKVAPTSVNVFGIELRKGSRIRLWPQKSADIIDLALRGKVAVIEAIEQDFDDQVHFAVVIEDDPGREFGMLRQPGHRFSSSNCTGSTSSGVKKIKMKSKLIWVTVSLAAIGMLVTMAPDIRRYIKMSRM